MSSNIVGFGKGFTLRKKKKSSGSEFGKGFIYNLILFSKHWADAYKWLNDYENMKEGAKKKGIKGMKGLFTESSAISLWFSGASDHFYELEIPKKWEKTKIGKIAKSLQDRALSIGHGAMFMSSKKASLKDFKEIFDDLEKLAMLIDKELGVKDKKADWN